MSKLVPLLLVLLIGVVAWQAVETSSLRSEVRRLDDDAITLQATLGELERKMKALPGDGEEPGLRREVASVPEAEAETAGATLLPRGADPEVIARAVRDLQTRVAEQEVRVDGVERRVDDDADRRPAFRFKPPIRTLDDADRRLELSGAQRADLERIVEYAKRDLEDLKQIPNEEGKTWKEVEASRTTTTTGEGGITMVMTNLAQMKFRESKIPGSDETFGQAEQRIRKRANDEVRDVLTPEQQKTWDENPMNGLVGSGATSTAFISMGATTTRESSKDD